MRTGIIARACLLALCAACGDSSGPADEVTVEMRDNTFSPATQTVSPGTTVRWRNVGAVPHNSTAATPGLWSSGNLDSGDSFPRRFDTVGTFAYSCSLHPTTMSGTIVVQ